MMIQSQSKSPRLTSVVVLQVPATATRREVLSFIGYVPQGTFDTTVKFVDDFSGEVAGLAAMVKFWTD